MAPEQGHPITTHVDKTGQLGQAQQQTQVAKDTTLLDSLWKQKPQWVVTSTGTEQRS